MQIPITREMAVQACLSMMTFYKDLNQLYKSHGMSLSQNRGRRNILMSAPMENFLAESMSESLCFPKVECDGRTGEADINVYTDDGQVEIECKLTSPHQSSGSIAFQTDHDTLANKGSLDYIYIIVNEDFDGFCVIYFQGLTIEDFRGLSPGARGKVQMYKWAGMKKATVLVGEAISSNDIKIKKITDIAKEKIEIKTSEMTLWRQEMQGLPNTSVYRKKKLTEQIHRGLDYIDSIVNKTADEVRITKQKNARYSFKYETLK